MSLYRYMCSLFLLITKSEIAELYGNSVFNFLKKLPICSKVAVPFYVPFLHTATYKGSDIPTSLSTLTIVFLFDYRV